MTPEDSTLARQRRERRPLVALIAGACVLVLGPIVGVLVTMKRLVSAFDTVGGTSVAPEDKAKVLAAGIETSMNATAIGVAISVVGLLVMAVAGFVLVLGRRDDTNEANEPRP